MTNPNLTHILVILDRSGSMSLIKSDTEGGYNTFIAEQAKADGECVVTLTQFDADFDTVYKNKPVHEVPPLNLVPRNSTALLDAIGKAVTEKGEELAALPEDQRPGIVTVLVLTDGWENASTEWTKETVRDLVTQQQEKYEWNFIFMGANQDAVLTGQEYGFSGANSLTYGTSGESVINAFAAASSNTAQYRGMRSAGVSYAAAASATAFTDEQREAADTE